MPDESRPVVGPVAALGSRRGAARLPGGRSRVDDLRHAAPASCSHRPTPRSPPSTPQGVASEEIAGRANRPAARFDDREKSLLAAGHLGVMPWSRDSSRKLICLRTPVVLDIAHDPPRPAPMPLTPRVVGRAADDGPARSVLESGTDPANLSPVSATRQSMVELSGGQPGMLMTLRPPGPHRRRRSTRASPRGCACTSARTRERPAPRRPGAALRRLTLSLLCRSFHRCPVALRGPSEREACGNRARRVAIFVELLVVLP